MSAEQASSSQNKIGVFPYIIAGMSFIPLIGVLFGVIAIVWGIIALNRGGKRLIIIGLLGITLTVTLYSSLYYFGFVKRGGIYDDLRKDLAQNNLNSLVQTVEFYKTQHGSYPDTLKTLESAAPQGSFVFITDPTDIENQPPREFYYQPVEGNKYYLRGVGADGQAFTADDIVPQIASGANSQVGLLIDKQ